MNDFYKRTLTSLLYENEEKEKESQDKKEIGDPGGLAITKVDLEKKLPALLNKINSWRDEIIWLLSKLEALIDFSDEELPAELEQFFNLKVSKMLD